MHGCGWAPFFVGPELRTDGAVGDSGGGGGNDTQTEGRPRRSIFGDSAAKPEGRTILIGVNVHGSAMENFGHWVFFVFVCFLKRFGPVWELTSVCLGGCMFILLWMNRHWLRIWMGLSFFSLSFLSVFPWISRGENKFACAFICVALWTWPCKFCESEERPVPFPFKKAGERKFLA